MPQVDLVHQAFQETKEKRVELVLQEDLENLELKVLRE